jgi:hypothetical protein
MTNHHGGDSNDPLAQFGRLSVVDSSKANGEQVAKPALMVGCFILLEGCWVGKII